MLARCLRALAAATLDLLYPPGCAACDEVVDVRDGAPPFCEPCAATLVSVDRPCSRCALPASDGTCAACLAAPPAYHAARAPYAYGGALAEALRQLKFAARTDLGARLGGLLAAPLAVVVAEAPDAVVVPVPLARARLATRGYNQAALLALGAAGEARVDTGLLARTRDGPAQVGLDSAARRAAVAGAFRASPGVTGRTIVLIDDVMTTGATLGACAQALGEAGAARVLALTVARALP